MALLTTQLFICQMLLAMNLFIPSTEQLSTSKADWLRYNGRSKDEYDLVTTKLAEYKQKLIDQRFPHMNLSASSNVDGSSVDAIDDMLMTSNQLNIWLQSLDDDANNTNNTDRKQHRKKRKVVDFSIFPYDQWPREINYKFDVGFTSEQEATIQEALDFWESKTCLSFVEQQASIEPIIIFTKPVASVCNSYIGLVYGEQLINLANGCLYGSGITQHEVGHALGLLHEQMRPDRDEYVEVIEENIDPANLGNFDKESAEYYTTYGLPYDYASVMHYSPTSFSTNGGYTLVPRDARFISTIGQRREASFYDVKIINMAYCAELCDEGDLPTACEHEGYQNPTDCSQCVCPDPWTGATDCSSMDYNADSSGCVPASGEIDVSSSVIKCVNSPNYDSTNGYYSEGDLCTWHLKIESVSHLVKMWFSTDGNTPQIDSEHYVEIRHESIDQLHGERFSGYGSEKYEYTSSNRLQFNASTDVIVMFRTPQADYLTASSMRRGFQLCFYSVAPPTPEPQTSPETTPRTTQSMTSTDNLHSTLEIMTSTTSVDETITDTTMQYSTEGTEETTLLYTDTTLKATSTSWTSSTTTTSGTTTTSTASPEITTTSRTSITSRTTTTLTAWPETTTTSRTSSTSRTSPSVQPHNETEGEESPWALHWVLIFAAICIIILGTGISALICIKKKRPSKISKSQDVGYGRSGWESWDSSVRHA